MKAIRVHTFGDPDVLQWEDVPDPKAASAQVLLRVKAAGVNPVETYMRAGKYGPQKFPFTPGNEAAGIVEAVGPEVTSFKPGDRVYTDKTITGSYAELTLADVDYVHPLPDNATFQQGAAIGTAGGAAYRALFHRGRTMPGETVLIHGGTGGVGTAAIQIARSVGINTVATASDEEGRKYCLEQGANHAVDHDVTLRPDEVKSLTGGKGFDVILEMLANKDLAADLPALARGGRVVVIGSRGKIEIDPRDLMSHESQILGVMLFGATPPEHRAMYSHLSAALEAGTFRPVIGLEIPLSQASKAHHEVIEGHHFGKIVLIP
jgi:NADPH2:quinone reductase